MWDCEPTDRILQPKNVGYFPNVLIRPGAEKSPCWVLILTKHYTARVACMPDLNSFQFPSLTSGFIDRLGVAPRV